MFFFFTCFWKILYWNQIAKYCNSNKRFVTLNADYSTFIKSSWWTRTVSTWQGHDSSTNVCIKIIISITNIKILIISPFFDVKKIKEPSFPSKWNSPFPTENERSTERRVNSKCCSLQFCKPSTSSRVCITVKNSPNPSSVYIRLCKHRKKVFYCFYKITLFLQ